MNVLKESAYRHQGREGYVPGAQDTRRFHHWPTAGADFEGTPGFGHVGVCYRGGPGDAISVEFLTWLPISQNDHGGCSPSSKV